MQQNNIKIMSVVGARPNFMKIAPFVHAIERWNKARKAEVGDQSSEHRGQRTDTPASRIPNPASRPQKIEHFLVHTGQHYDPEMYHSFFEALNIPTPDIDLGVGSGTHAEQVGNTMIAFEKVLVDQKPDWVVVVGDVNATCACSVTAKKHHVPVAHIEAGLRSGDRHMPEEINRLVTDAISDLLLTPDEFANINLAQEGHGPDDVEFVGNIMIDTLEAHRTTAEKLVAEEIVRDYAIEEGAGCQVLGARKNNKPQTPTTSHLSPGSFAVLTLHRPSNVDNPATLAALVKCLREVIAAEMPLIWSVHPRTRKNLQHFGLWNELIEDRHIILIRPIGYHAMLKLNMEARVMLTDSGGLQEECCVLGTPCITMRESTERPITLVENGGVSQLTGPDPSRITEAFKVFSSLEKSPFQPPLWDGRTAERIVQVFVDRQKSDL